MKVRLVVAGLAALIMSALVASGASALVAKNVGGSASIGKPGDNNGSTAGTGGKRERTGTKSYTCPDSMMDADSQDEGIITVAGTNYAWPPNHKYRDIKITVTEIADEDADADDVTVSSFGSHDQVTSDGEELNGSGHTAMTSDVSPNPAFAGPALNTVTVAQQFRGERSGRDKSGRTYSFDVTATFDDGSTMCTSPPGHFTAFVPHDQGQHSEPSARRR